MDLKEFDLHALTILWESTTLNLDYITDIENEIKNRVISNSKFSKEYLFDISKILGKSMTITFIPTTDSFNRYGSFINVDLFFTENETLELSNNLSAKPLVTSKGQVKAKAKDKNALTHEQSTHLENVGFYTYEVLTINY